MGCEYYLELTNTLYCFCVLLEISSSLLHMGIVPRQNHFQGLHK